MSDAFAQLEPEYARLISQATIMPARQAELTTACSHLLNDKGLYRPVQDRTSVPMAVVMALAEREMTGNVHCYLGNGQPLNRRTTIVPIGRGPFADFLSGCLDALRLDGLDKVSPWTLPRACYETEVWNGFGYRSHGIPSPYVFGATTVQRPGKFVRDHDYVSTLMDPQLGTLAIIEELVRLDPSLSFYDTIEKAPAPPELPVQPHPVIGAVNVERVQRILNELHGGCTPVHVDGNCDRATRAAVWEFQRTHHLVLDGLPGPKTYAALLEAEAEAGL